MDNTHRKQVLFVCTHNAIRSPIAEGYMREKYSAHYDVFSAGTDPREVNPFAIRVMKEIGIDISGHLPTPLMHFFDQDIDIAITVCDSESGACPMIPGAGTVIHQAFADPGVCEGTEEECLEQFRKVRDEITTWIDTTFG